MEAPKEVAGGASAEQLEILRLAAETERSRTRRALGPRCEASSGRPDGTVPALPAGRASTSPDGAVTFAQPGAPGANVGGEPARGGGISPSHVTSGPSARLAPPADRVARPRCRSRGAIRRGSAPSNAGPESCFRRRNVPPRSGRHPDEGPATQHESADRISSSGCSRTVPRRSASAMGRFCSSAGGGKQRNGLRNWRRRKSGRPSRDLPATPVGSSVDTETVASPKPPPTRGRRWRTRSSAATPIGRSRSRPASIVRGPEVARLADHPDAAVRVAGSLLPSAGGRQTKRKPGPSVLWRPGLLGVALRS